MCNAYAIHNCLGLRVEVAWNGRAGVCVECVQSDPTSRRVGERARGEEGGELRKLRVQAVYLTINTKGLGGREEKDVILIWGADREFPFLPIPPLPTLLLLPFPLFLLLK